MNKMYYNLCCYHATATAAYTGRHCDRRCYPMCGMCYCDVVKRKNNLAKSDVRIKVNFKNLINVINQNIRYLISLFFCAMFSRKSVVIWRAGDEHQQRLFAPVH